MQFPLRQSLLRWVNCKITISRVPFLKCLDSILRETLWRGKQGFIEFKTFRYTLSTLYIERIYFAYETKTQWLVYLQVLRLEENQKISLKRNLPEFIFLNYYKTHL